MGSLCCKEKTKSNEVRGISRKSFYEREIKVSFENGEDDLSKENPTIAAASDDVAKDKENSDNSDVQLIKLGNELHGPEDQMQITKDQVLFWENLKADGKVSKAIDSYVKE